MKLFLATLTLVFASYQEVKAQDITVVDVRRNITLAEDDQVYKDFYLSIGPNSGLKKNLVVTAVRRLNIRDASGAHAVGEIIVPVGQLKVIAIYDQVAVAREFTLLSRDELPMLEQIGIMTGDKIEIKGSFIDNSRPKKKREVAQDNSSISLNPVDSAKPLETPSLSPQVLSNNTTTPVEILEKTADSGNNTLHE